jgi:PleD family two-component response regulator
VPNRITQDVIIADVTELDDTEQLIEQLRKNISSMTYVMLILNEYTRSYAHSAGVNDYLYQPFEHDDFKEKIDNAIFRRKLCDHLTDEREDFHSAGGIISKSAFKQLYISTLDRSRRYGENTGIILIGLSNFRDILENDGPYAAEYAAAKLSQAIVSLRRQADIVGQTDKHEYGLLLMDPKSNNEAIAAADRFAEGLSKCSDLYEGGARQASLYVQSILLSSGVCLRDHRFHVAKATDH